MVRKVDVKILDDLTGEAADTSVVFGVDGRWYQLDLTAENAEQVTA